MKTSILIPIACIAGILVSCGKKPADPALLTPSEQVQVVPEEEVLEEMPATADSLQLEIDSASIAL
ncbi:hypothetical protein SAMN05192553_106154 [Cyclobacterium xiamenense]|jgi:hypothetical protein|uniref:Uncharacterized protein n=1 Tax=Cyclobacterium xiamenense TaxID=1297121 RepID=A0A1H7ANE8_9BACT|nr:hypothetical protein [Cyclobacterium xiamenense]SEJ62545.1 hypothetical protein SAMN05192553_106154 [Cyclobacterium xiamenense]